MPFDGEAAAPHALRKCHVGDMLAGIPGLRDRWRELRSDWRRLRCAPQREKLRGVATRGSPQRPFRRSLIATTQALQWHRSSSM